MSRNKDDKYIYFEFDAYHINQTVAKELDKVTLLMKKHPVLRLEASTHTDTRGQNIVFFRKSGPRSSLRTC